MNRILVIVVTYNGLRWIDRCLCSLRASHVPLDVIAVDNASNDGTPDHIRKCFPEVRVVENKKNIGFGRANNIGFRYALENDYEYVYLLNEDAWVMPDTVSRLLDAFSAGRYGIISPVQLDASMTRMDTRFRKHCSQVMARSEDDLVDMGFVMAAHWMMPVECVRRVGGFSPSFRHYGEDENYINRVHYHGYKVAVLKSAKAVHDRAERNDSRIKTLRLKRISCVVRLSDPNRNLPVECLLQPFRMLGMSIKNLSLYLLAGIPAFIARYPELFLNRRLSFSEGAFLEEH